MAPNYESEDEVESSEEEEEEEEVVVAKKRRQKAWKVRRSGRVRNDAGLIVSCAWVGSGWLAGGSTFPILSFPFLSGPQSPQAGHVGLLFVLAGQPHARQGGES